MHIGLMFTMGIGGSGIRANIHTQKAVSALDASAIEHASALTKDRVQTFLKERPVIEL